MTVAVARDTPVRVSAIDSTDIGDVVTLAIGDVTIVGFVQDLQRMLEKASDALGGAIDATFGAGGVGEVDHTPGVMRCEFQILGGHVHCAVFGPFSGKAGDLVFRVEEWDHVRRSHPGWQFKERL